MKSSISVGIGVLILNTSNQILFGKRIGKHGGTTWGPPGGHLEFGETFETCSKREVFEETGLQIQAPTFFAITNDFFEDTNKHYVSIFMITPYPDQQKVINCEPHKFEHWKWFDGEAMPSGLFLPLKNLLTEHGYGQKLKSIFNKATIYNQ